MNYFNIGIVGHINHGKTELTMALTGVNTDKLKEEINRRMSIELGFAPLYLKEDMTVTIIDVPGHEKFLSKMISSLHCTNLIIVVISGLEGVQHQTIEHLDILSLLDSHSIIPVITKSSLMKDEHYKKILKQVELLKRYNITKENLVFVDSISHLGIDQLKSTIHTNLKETPININYKPLLFHIDQIANIKGHGKIIKGILQNDTISIGEKVTLEPSGETFIIKQMQTHKKNISKAFPNQRVAIKLTNSKIIGLKRGYVVTKSNTLLTTTCIDVRLKVSDNLVNKVKQGEKVKFYSGTSETIGSIRLFDRNIIDNTNDSPIYCQIRLEKPILVTNNDRFLVRRLTPKETIGGGIIVNAHGIKYKFGLGTSIKLSQYYNSSILERIILLLENTHFATCNDLAKTLCITEEHLLYTMEMNTIILHFSEGVIYTKKHKLLTSSKLLEHINNFHLSFPTKLGIHEAELINNFESQLPNKNLKKIINNLIYKKKCTRINSKIRAYNFSIGFSNKIIQKKEEYLLHYDKDIPINIKDFKSFLSLGEKESNEYLDYIFSNEFTKISSDYMITTSSLQSIIVHLKETFPNSFELKEVKSIINLQRKYIVIILEYMDRNNFTNFKNGIRTWKY